MAYSELREQRAHGTPEFPMQYYFVDQTHPRYEMALHWHNEFEIVHVRSGRFDAFVRNQPYPMLPGDTLLIDCGALHRGVPHACVYEVLVFDVSMLRRHSIESMSRYILPILNQSAHVRTHFSSSDPEVTGIVERIFAAAREQETFFELALFSLFFELFHTLYRQGAVSGAAEDRRDLPQLRCMMELLSWIEEHYTEPVTLADLAGVAGVSEKYLCRFFRKYTAETPMAYIIRKRIDSACNRMRCEGMNVTEAAFASGFNDPSYFSRRFRALKGITPRAYLASCEG